MNSIKTLPEQLFINDTCIYLYVVLLKIVNSEYMYLHIDEFIFVEGVSNSVCDWTISMYFRPSRS